MSTPSRQQTDLMHLLARSERLLARRLKAVLDTEGYSLDSWRVLSLLSDGAGHHMTEIADHAFLPAPTLTKLVDQLVDDNLVHRRIDPVDRRRIRAYLTARGRAAYQRVNQSVQSVCGDLLAPEDEVILSDVLTRMVGALQGQPAADAVA